MSELNLAYSGNDRKKSPVSNVLEFAQVIEKEANSLDRSGWTNEATHLRKWASELKGKAAKADYAQEKSKIFK